jgi:hypothetical protein
VRTLLAATFLTLLVCAEAFAAISPPNPTTHDFIVYHTMIGEACEWEDTVVRNGSQITVTFANAGGGCSSAPGHASAVLGFLPAGEYIVTSYLDLDGFPQFHATEAFVVAPAIREAVPTLDARAMALLLAALSVTGVFVMRNRG